MRYVSWGDLFWHTELEFLKSQWGLGTEEEYGYRTGPPGYDFQDHRRVTEQLLDTQAAIRKQEQALWRRLLAGISPLVRDKQAEL